MHALFFDGRQPRLDQHYPDPAPAPGEALLHVLLAGICATDLEIVRGYAGFSGVLGHELVGRVIACEIRPELVGQRVVDEINAGCGACAPCRAGRREHCQQRQVLGIRNRDGVFADYVVVPVENLHVVPDNVPDQAAVFTEPLAAALRIQEQIDLRPTDRVLVLGDGKLGQLIARSLAGTGCELLVQGRSLARRGMALLREAGIATAAAGDIPPDWADVVVECTGSPAGFDQALALLRPEGTLVLKSTYADPGAINLSRVVVDEISVVGSRCGPFQPALAALASGEVDPLPLIDAVYPLAEGLAAMEHAARPGALKVLVQP
jgi:threonine dehydrogenase-like Zn-dependent dehydrogenase